ncbi:Senescence regulator [Artemisia annua]|uniref:Senescence regulator n=1 Tax=Artemisia annua TaxID=35608 RepID=A0A2U1NM20_ARTAN|nr:Senescence regulator [Artemisia annua]
MEPQPLNSVNSYRHHRRSPSSDRFLGVFSPPSSTGVISGGSSVAGDDFSEDDVFWTGDFTEQKDHPIKVNNNSGFNGNSSFRHNGILAALPENNRHNRPLINRTASSTMTSSKLIPSIPRPSKVEREVKFQQSAPVNVPMFKMKVRTGGGAGRTLKGRDLRLVRNAVWRKTGFLD